MMRLNKKQIERLKVVLSHAIADDNDYQIEMRQMRNSNRPSTVMVMTLNRTGKIVRTDRITPQGIHEIHTTESDS